ncbi:MAG TPA: glycosyltransferase family 2 protein [Anaerolineales bacterium]|nr:glycosyltransferase family 2 protein [Anaerolineales bacterium]
MAASADYFRAALTTSTSPTVPPLLSVIIPCLNEARHLSGVLDGLASQDFSDFEIVLVDGGSTDDTLLAARQWAAAHSHVAMRVIDNPHRHTPHGLNKGVLAAHGQIIARLDGHCRPAPDYLRRCLAVLNRPGAAVAGGVFTVRPDGPGRIAQAIALAVSTPLGAGDAAYRLGGGALREVDTVPFGCFRRQTWEVVGGYNEGLLANEDYEFYVRVRLGGGKVYLDPEITCEYVARPTFGALARQYWRYGWWKAQVVRRYPTSLRLRQAVPALWALISLALIMIAVIWPPARPAVAAVWTLYFLVVLAESLRCSKGDYAMWLLLAWAYLIIHFAWGWGAWIGCLSGRLRK